MSSFLRIMKFRTGVQSPLSLKALLTFGMVTLGNTGCERAPIGSYSSLKDTAQDRAIQALAIFGAPQATASGQPERCATCHSMTSSRIRDWTYLASDVHYTCIENLDQVTWAAESSEVARSAVECVKNYEFNLGTGWNTSALGFFSAALPTQRFQNLVHQAYGDDGFRAELDAALVAQMPPLDLTDPHQWAITDEEFDKVLAWTQEGLPFVEIVLGEAEQPPTSCTPFTSPEMTSHIERMKSEGWSALHRDNALIMFGCQGSNPRTDCFSGVGAAGQALFPLVQDTEFGRSWSVDTPTDSMRILTKLDFYTSFWARTSPDGRFMAVGGGSDAGSTVLDLNPILVEQPARHIQVSASYDPSFFPDNSGFMFQGGGTGVCPMSVLLDPANSIIDWTQPGCTREGVHISLYQGVGASLDGSDFLAVTGDFNGDGGGSSLGAYQFGAQSSAHFQMFINDGQQYVNTVSTNMDTPFRGDYNVSPSNQLFISHLTGMDANGEPAMLGYEFSKLDRTIDPSGGLTVTTTLLATACMDGLKGMHSLDERYWVTYAPVKATDFAEFGFAAADDPAFQEYLTKGASNIYVYDGLLNTTKRITRVAPGQFAKFPHYRSDGWIVFLVFDETPNGATYLVASDATVESAAAE